MKILVSLFFCTLTMTAKSETCSKQLYAKATHHSIGLGFASPVLLIGASAIVFWGAYIFELKRYAALLKAASLEYAQMGNEASAKIINKFYQEILAKDEVKRKRIEMDITKIRGETRQKITYKPLKPISINKEKIIFILDQLNTEPGLRKTCLKEDYLGLLNDIFKSDQTVYQYENKITKLLGNTSQLDIELDDKSIDFDGE